MLAHECGSRPVGDPENDAITVAAICRARALHTGKRRSAKRQWISITLGEFARGGGGDENNLRPRDCETVLVSRGYHHHRRHPPHHRGVKWTEADPQAQLNI